MKKTLLSLTIGTYPYYEIQQQHYEYH